MGLLGRRTQVLVRFVLICFSWGEYFTTLEPAPDGTDRPQMVPVAAHAVGFKVANVNSSAISLLNSQLSFFCKVLFVCTLAVLLTIRQK